MYCIVLYESVGGGEWMWGWMDKKCVKVKRRGKIQRMDFIGLMWVRMDTLFISSSHATLFCLLDFANLILFFSLNKFINLKNFFVLSLFDNEQIKHEFVCEQFEFRTN